MYGLDFEDALSVEDPMTYTARIPLVFEGVHGFLTSTAHDILVLVELKKIYFFIC